MAQGTDGPRVTARVLATALVLVALAQVSEAKDIGISRIRNRLSNLRHSHRGGAQAAAAAQAAPGGHYMQPQHQHGHYAPTAYYTPAYPGVHHHGGHHGGHGGAAAASAAAAATGAHKHYTPEPVYAQPEPVHHVPYGRYQQHHYPHRHAAPVYGYQPHARPASGGGSAASSAAAAGGRHGGAGAASSAASGGSHGGAASSAAAAAGGAGAAGAAAANGAAESSNAHVVQDDVYDEHYVMPEHENTYAAQTGTYANDGDGHESSSYVRETENVENHEDGKEDENHYYNAHSYGKTYDENKHEGYNNVDEDVLHTPNVYRSKKSSTNYVKDLNKARRESGSGVLAHDKHSASYNKNSRRFKENVDQRYNKNFGGVHDSSSYATAEAHEDEDEDRYDSDGLGTFVGVDGHHHQRHPGFVRPGMGGAAAASGSAGSDANGQGVASSSAAVGGQAASSSAGAGGASGAAGAAAAH